VLLANGAANRDPAVFPDPDKIDITRRPNDHLGLAIGRHFCLGAPVARLEGKIVFDTLARQIPHVQLAADPRDIRYRKHVFLRGLEELPITLNDGQHAPLP